MWFGTCYSFFSIRVVYLCVDVVNDHNSCVAINILHILFCCSLKVFFLFLQIGLSRDRTWWNGTDIGWKYVCSWQLSKPIANKSADTSKANGNAECSLTCIKVTQALISLRLENNCYTLLVWLLSGSELWSFSNWGISFACLCWSRSHSGCE